MSVAINDAIADTVASPIVPRRPAWVFSIVLDVLLGASTYLASYWLRFESDRLALFLPAAWATMPIVVIGQIAGLLCLNAYAPRPRTSWLSRVVVGGVLGTVAAALATRIVQGFAGVSRMAFVADAVFFSIAAIGWRGAWVLRSRARARAAARLEKGVLVDRADDMTLGAVVGSLYRYRGLLKALVLKDLKLKYRGSVFGFLWSLANPLLMIVVYTIAFTVILRVRNEMFVFYLMLGQLSWSFFASSATMSTGSITENGGLLRTVLFPRAILPIGTVLFNLAQYLLTVAVFLPVMMAWYRIEPVAPMVLFPVLLALQVMFTIGVALILSSVTVFFRDVRHLVEIALAVLFWMTPIVYEISQVPERLRLLILLTPVSPYIVAYQKIFFYREWPEPTLWLVTVTYAIGAFLVGSASILAFEDRFTEQV